MANTIKVGSLIPEVTKERNSSLERQQKSAKVLELIEKHPTYESFCVRFNPDNQLKLAVTSPNHVKCFNYNYPTLSTIANAYSERAVINWLKIQFENLNDYIGAKEKMTLDQLTELSTFIYSDCWFFNVSEIFLFFIQLKSGRFCEFYGFVDPLKIMKAKNEFIENRINELRKHDEYIKQKQLDIDREEWKKNAITYEEYIIMKRKESLKKLKNLTGKQIKRNRK